MTCPLHSSRECSCDPGSCKARPYDHLTDEQSEVCNRSNLTVWALIGVAVAISALWVTVFVIPAFERVNHAYAMEAKI